MRRCALFGIWLAGVLFAAAVWVNGWHALLADRDFVSFWTAGRLALAGNPAGAYDPQTIRAAAAQWLGTTSKLVFPYPPHSLLFAVPLAMLPLKVSFWLWQAVSAALFCVAAKPHLPKGFPAILAIFTPAALINAAFGQVGLFTGALWLFAFGGSAFAAAALTFKPHLGFLVAVEMVRRRLVVKTMVIASLLVLLSVVLFGPAAWVASLKSGAGNQLAMLVGGAMSRWPTQMTTPLLAYGIIGWLLFAAAALFLLWRRFTVFTAATATFLIAPYGFHYDMTVVCLGFGVLLFERWDALPLWRRLVCAAAYLAPAIVAAGSWLIPPLLLAGLYVQTRDDSALAAGEPGLPPSPESAVPQP